MIPEVIPTVYFFILLTRHIIKGFSQLYLYGTWMHFLLHNFNAIRGL